MILPAEKENKIQEKEEKSPDISQAKETVPNNTQTREAVSLDITQVVLDTGKEGVPNEKVTSSSVNTTSDTFPTELADFGYELRGMVTMLHYVTVHSKHVQMDVCGQ